MIVPGFARSVFRRRVEARAFLCLSMFFVLFGLARVPAGAAEHGYGLYLRHCAECHGYEARGDGPIARAFERPVPDLRVLDPKRFDVEELSRFVLEEKRARLVLRPEALRQHASRTEALYRFLTTLPRTDWKAVEAGEEVFLTRCIECHDPHGRPRERLPEGVRAPRDLADASLQTSSGDEELLTSIRHGRRAMPALVPPVSEREARTLLPYVRVLSPGFRLYDRYCLSCHGPRGGGATGALEEFPAPRFAFDEKYFETRDEEHVRSAIWHMLREEERWMPHFKGILSEEQVRAILAHLRSLPSEKDKDR